MIYVSLISTILVLFIGIIFHFRTKEKKQSYYIFLMTIISEFLWCVYAVLGRIYIITNFKFILLNYISLCLMILAVSSLPIMILLTGKIFKEIVVKLNKWNYIAIIDSCLTIVLFLTNDWHHLIFIKVDSFIDYEWGIYFFGLEGQSSYL